MTISLFSFWSNLGNELFKKRYPSKLAWFFLFIYLFFFFYGKEVEESLEGHSFVYILNATDEKII